MTRKRFESIAWPLSRGALLLTGALGLGHAAVAAVTDVAQVPLVTSSATVVKPNVMFILDDSGSMGWDFMPDNVNNFGSSAYGRLASQCNGLAYNPSIAYALPVDSVGVARPIGSYTFAAPSNSIRTVSSPASVTIASGSIAVTLGGSGTYSVGDIVTLFSFGNTDRRMVGTVTNWNSGSQIATVNVTITSGSGSITDARIATGDNLPYYYSYTGSQAKLSYTYNSGGVITSTSFYGECNSNAGSAPGSSVFAKAVITPYSTDVQNYRNWYTYYRTRMLMMKSAVSRAFQPIGDRYRVGFSTISTTRVDGSNFLDMNDFAAGQKSSFYTNLYAANPSGSTPLRGALSKAGQYFAKKGVKTDGSAQTVDPVQYSCQRNYTILTTDGYWNTGLETASYGPYKLDGSNVGQQDGSGTPRPMKDGAGTTVRARTSDLQQRSITVQAQTSTSNLQQRSITTQLQSATTSLQRRTGALQIRTSNDKGATWSAWSNTSSCRWNVEDEQCRYNWGAWSNAATCNWSQSTGTSDGTTWSISNGTDCQYTTPVYVNTASCTAVAQSPGPNYTVATATLCNSVTTYGAWSNTPTCTASATTGCQYTAWTAYANTASCAAVAQSAGPNYTVGTATQCNSVTTLGAWSNTATCSASATTGCQYTAWTAFANVVSCTAAAQSVAPSYTVGTARECQTTVTGGIADTLADVAMYYYQTDLRTTALNNCSATVNGNPIDVCLNNVAPSGADTALHQHMQTFTLGMGVSGTLRYQPDYLSAASGDFYDIVQGTKDWPNATGTTGAENVDDLWHAAVNGRGMYFSAVDPVSLADGLATSLAAIIATLGSGSGAAASTLQPVASDKSVFIAKYKSGFWIGDLVSHDIDPVTGAISAPVWSAAAKLQASVNAGTPRTIYYMARTVGANSGALRSFTYPNLQFDGLNGHFDNACSKAVSLTQCATLAANKAAADAAYAANPTPANQTAQTAANAALASANSGNGMVSYLRGGSNAVYRTRVTTDADIPGGILGDVIGGAPVYVRQPSFKYTENNYAGFVAAINATNPQPSPALPLGRRGIAYVASNDGMLHAIDGATGNERWAYVPSMVMDRMYRLADKDYANRHEYFVNGAPVIGDIYVPAAGTWKTILVGGLAAGGRGYYALDITDPDNPIALWEFTNDSLGGNANLGLTFGNPVITKRADGTWVVAFTSGYNNVGPGDGNGHLFMVNANSGLRVLDIATLTSGPAPAGTATTPSGLGKINAWIDSEIDNTAKRFYGGDLLGNLWRFDTDSLVAPNQAALQMAYFSAGGVAQPITTQPSLAEVNYSGSKYPVVYVGTGKYLGTTDLANTNMQTVYALKDPMANTPLGDVRASPSVIAQTLSLSNPAQQHSSRAITQNAVNWATDNGWKVDLTLPAVPRPGDLPALAAWPAGGERVNVDMQLLHNTLTVASNVPSNDVCSAGGNSYLYRFDIGTGSVPSTLGGNIAGLWLGGSMVVGMSWVTLQAPGGAAGSGRTITLTGNNLGQQRGDDVPPPSPPTASGRRTSWRELVH